MNMVECDFQTAIQFTSESDWCNPHHPYKPLVDAILGEAIFVADASAK